MNNELVKISEEIRGLVKDYQDKHGLYFIEDTHTYFIKDKYGNEISDLPSVSTLIKNFYTPFDATKTKAFQRCEGNKLLEEVLLKKWSDTAVYANNKGSRVHYILEKETLKRYNSYKTVRKPIFECDEQQTIDGDNMIKAGIKFIANMHERGCVLLDTEMVLGNLDLGYFGQPDTLWLFKKGDKLGIISSDFKTNKPKNFEKHFYTKKMLPPFQKYDDTALSHYYIQQPLYVRLLIKMLEGTKYGNIDYFGGLVVLLKDSGELKEYRIPKDVTKKVFNLDKSQLIKH